MVSGASFGVPNIFANEKSSDATAFVPRSLADENGGTKPGSREFFLSADKSFADHQSNVERLSYYWGFPSSTRSYAYDDLVKSVPLEGLATISVTPDMLPNRIVKQRISKVANRKTLRQLRMEGTLTNAQ